MRQVAELIETVRAHGVPASRYELVADVPSAVAIVQELLPGGPAVLVDHRVIGSVLTTSRFCLIRAIGCMMPIESLVSGLPEELVMRGNVGNDASYAEDSH